MKTAQRTIFAFLFSVLCVMAWGADPIVTVKGIPPSEAIPAGNVATLTVVLDIHKPYHVNAHEPLEDFLIPTVLEVEPDSGLTVGNILYPAAEMKTFSFSDTAMAVYEGSVKISIEVTPGTALKGRDTVLKGKVRYQACTDSTCLPEASEPFTVGFSVSNSVSPQIGSMDAEPASGNQAPSGGAQAGGAPASTEQADAGIGRPGFLNFGERSFPVMLFFVFLGGLALNLTPCVYPMIPITITYFGGQAQGRKGSLIAHAILYVVGMSVTYSALGVAAALTGGMFGAALQHPPVLIGIALVMILLALSMFDVYELRMPGFLNRLAGGNRTGFAGTFIMGLTVGIVAAPCIGPFILALLTYVGNRGNALVGFLLFFILSLGLGIPLLVLGIFSGSIRRLPRSGEWMVWVRHVFGFILLAMAVFFLRTLFPNPLVYPLALAFILALAGIYLAWIVPVAGAGRGFAWVRNLVGVFFFVAALFTAVTGLQSYLESFSNFKEAQAIEWLPYSVRILDRASVEGMPVMIDFTADWCAPCKELDRHTFTESGVIELSRQFMALKVDLTETSPEGESVRRNYGIPGPPTVLFLRPDGSEMEALRVTGFEPADTFLLKMKEAYRISTENRQPSQ